MLLQRFVEHSKKRYDYLSGRVYHSNVPMLECAVKFGFKLGYVDIELKCENRESP